MKVRVSHVVVVVAVCLACGTGGVAASPLGTGFTYQGQVLQSGVASSGLCDFQFSLWDALGSGDPPSGGTQVGVTQYETSVSVTDGLFTVLLNPGGVFGANPFAGDERWLQIGVRCPSGFGSFTVMSPRQQLTAVPNARYAASAGSASDLACTGCVSGTDLADGTVTSNEIASGAVSSAQIATGSIQPSHLAFTPGTVTSITAGAGLTGGTISSSGTVAVHFGAEPGTVAPGEHSHVGQYWFTAAPGSPGLAVLNSATTPFTAGIVGEQNSMPVRRSEIGGAAGPLATSPPAGVVGWSSDGVGVYGYTSSAMGAGMEGEAGAGDGVRGSSASGTGVSGTTATGRDGVYGETARALGLEFGVHGVANGHVLSVGVFGESTIGGGVAGGSQSGPGVTGITQAGRDGVYGQTFRTAGLEFGVHGVANGNILSAGVYGESTIGVGAAGSSGSGPGVSGLSTTGNALFALSGGAGRDQATVRANNSNTSLGMAAYFTNQSTWATAHFANAGSGQVLWLQNGGSDFGGTGGGDFITAVNSGTGMSGDTQFRVLSSGEARSDVGFATPAADFAEMLPAVTGLEPGDVLAIGPDGQLTRTTAAGQTSVAGVYSTSPGFVGGRATDGDAPGTVPLAVVGVVPVKASAENGPVRPGDLLVAAATPGHAMDAGPDPAVGTVLGKALDQLENGSGVIRVLVTLQ